MALLPAEIIKKKRNGQPLNEEEILFFIENYTSGKIPDYQMSALLMAIYFQGMNDSETLSLTKAMLHSGITVDMSAVSGFKVDKHSTGGVGDKTSLILGPIVAAAGLTVPMISGRGLGHTGGTLDKLESIPGFNTQLSLEKFIEALKKIKICFIGQTKEICPADKKIYALRDVTATIESFPLICASILSKKLAEGIDGLVLDVKYGSGAFMQDSKKAESLAIELMKIARGYNKKVTTLITNMDQPLGRYSGNALEVFECLEIMRGHSHPHYEDTKELSLQLSAHMLFLGKVCDTFSACYSLAKETLENGKALKKFEELCQLHGGDLKKLPTAKHKLQIMAKSSGYIKSMNTEFLGIAGILIKAGRAKVDDVIEPTAGIEFHAKVGEFIRAKEALFTLYGANEALFDQAAKVLEKSVVISEEKSLPQPLILKTLSEMELP